MRLITKENRLAARWVPENSEKHEHPDGLGVAYIFVPRERTPRQNYAWQVVAYRGTAGHSEFNYVYRTREQADAKIAEFFSNLTASHDYRVKARESRKADAMKELKPGDYVDVARTAKLIRTLLTRKFPDAKFSVRSDSYSMGASIDISWTNGPSEKQVHELTDAFAGAGFDGMIDLKYSVSSWLLPDGSAAYGQSSGTVGSRGVQPEFDNPAPAPGAIKVHFGSDYVHLHRNLSPAAMQAIAEDVSKRYGYPLPELKVETTGSWFPSADHDFMRHFREIERDLTL
jgi:hypothetical protein